MVLVIPLPTKPKDFPKKVDTSSQVSALNDAEMEDASLEEIPAPSSPTAEAPEPHGDTSPTDVAHLCKEANKALGDLLMVKSSINAHQWKLVLEFSMAICENNSDYRVCQGGKGHLHLFHSGSGDLLFCGHQGGRDLLFCGHQGGRDLLFCGHQGGRGLKGLPSGLHSVVTP